MHWLQALDTSLFFFVNRSLANSFFDWLMPVLSGNAFFIPVLILLVVGLLWKGGTRMRLCVLLLLLILPLGDTFICNTIKHAVARPRPFVTLPEARYFGSIGKGYIPPQINEYGVDMSAGIGSRTSMPSSHAANWFAATMILFIFYRRCLWLSPFHFRASITAFIIPATCSSARFWARVTRRRERLRCKRGGGGLEKNGSRSGTRNCPRS